MKAKQKAIEKIQSNPDLVEEALDEFIVDVVEELKLEGDFGELSHFAEVTNKYLENRLKEIKNK